MANGIGRVWAANAGDDEQRPNGVGSVWIENIDALAPSGGASEQQINELSAAIDYVSANAGDPNALTGYQASADISATKDLFKVSGGGEVGYVINANPALFEAKGPAYDLSVGYGGHLTAQGGASAKFEYSSSAVFTNGSKFYNTNNALVSADGSHGFVTSSNYHDLRIENAGKLSASNSCSAVFTNGSQFYNTNNALVSADGNFGFLVSAGNDRFISAAPWGLRTKNASYDIKADYTDGFYIAATGSNYPFRYKNSYYDISLANQNFPFNFSSNNGSAWIGYNGVYGFSGANAIGSFGTWNGDNNPFNNHYINGVGFSAGITKFGVYAGGNLIASGMGSVKADNSCSATFTNGSRTEITNGHVLLVGNNELGTYNGITVSGNGKQFISIYNAGSVKVVNGAEVNLSGVTTKIGSSLNASGSQFVSADGEGVSAWAAAPMTVMGAFNQTSSNAAFVIGNGTGNTARRDLFVIDYSGNAKCKDFVAEQAPIVHTVTGNLYAFNIGDDYYYDSILSSDLGVDLTKVSISVDFSNLDSGSKQIMNYRGISGYDEPNSYTWNNVESFVQNFEHPFSTSSTFTGYTTIEGDPSSMTGVSAIQFVLDVNNTKIPYTATWVEEVAPKSLTELYNAFTAYTASHP